MMEDIEAIRKRLEAAEPGPWRWMLAYECRGTHWCLENDASAATGSTINHHLVTLSTEEYEYDDDGQPTRLDQTPEFQLISHAPADIAFLLSRLAAERARADERERESAALLAEMSALRAELEAVKGRERAMREALTECANELETAIRANYDGILDYPHNQAKLERDLEPVTRARDVLAK
jgi:hypothetical protein